MPPSSTLLGARERYFFALWLATEIEKARVSKLAIAKALGDSATQRVNRYLVSTVPGRRRLVFPGQQTLRKIADALDLPMVPTLFRAGYYVEPLSSVRKLVELSTLWIAEDELIDDAGERQKASLKKGADKKGLICQHKCAGLKSRYERLERPAYAGCYIAAPTALALRITVAWFKQRGRIFSTASDKFASSLFDRRSPNTRLLEKAQRDEKIANLEPRRWPRALRNAAQLLQDGDLPPEARRFASAELVHAWAHSTCPAFYAQASQTFYESEATTE